jgi:alkylhydroperoxidase/carboxymuconolactone decarboxylase family protein YurZ
MPHQDLQRENAHVLDWIGATLAQLMKLSPDTVRGYQTLSAANSKTGKLDEKTRQLISLAVAVTTHRDGWSSTAMRHGRPEPQNKKLLRLWASRWP